MGWSAVLYCDIMSKYQLRDICCLNSATIFSDTVRKAVLLFPNLSAWNGIA